MNTGFTARQRLAYHLTKNRPFDAKSNRDIYAASIESRPNFPVEYEAEKKKEEIETEMTAIAGSGVRMVFLGEEGYPSLLSEIPDAPLMLFVRSITPPEELFNGSGKQFNAIVGTRDASRYGIVMTERLADKLSQTTPGITIVSGLAIGVDILAHREALYHGMGTIAVLPSSLENIYPAAHKNIAEKIAKTKGCALVSPFVPGTAPLATNFLLRNRIIAGMSDATYIVESKIKGGALITARLADSYDRDVFAIPGHIGDTRSEGCNALIREGTALLADL